jgi:uncharacterized protein YbjT (DUF2867 family)
VGRELLHELRLRGQRIRAAAREPLAASRCIDTETDWIRFDYQREETFAPALEGVDRVFMLLPPGDNTADIPAASFIRRMCDMSVRAVVDLSAMRAELNPMMAVRKVELFLEDCGLTFTHLRPNWFMQIFATGSLQEQVCGGRLYFPANRARISYIDARDIAAAAAMALTETGHGGKAYTLTGPAALDHFEIARILSEAAERTVIYEPNTDEQAREAMSQAGIALAQRERLIGFYRFVREGFCEAVRPDLGSILRREPTSFDQFASDYAQQWNAKQYS